MGGIISKITDDVLGLDPNGGGIYDVPVVGDVVDDVLGFDPGHSPLQHILRLAGYTGAAVLGTDIYNHVANGGSIKDYFPTWDSLSGADKATALTETGLSAPAAEASTGSGWFNAVKSTGGDIASAVGVLSGGSGVGDNSGPTGIVGFLDDTLGLDPNGGGVFDPVTGVLNPSSDINTVSTALTGNSLLDKINDELGYSVAGTTGSGGFDTSLIPSAQPYIDQQQRLTGAQQDKILGLLEGSDEASNELARQAAEATGGTFGSSGTFGSARHAQAANNAAAQQLLGAQERALSQIPTAVSTATTPYDTGIAGFKNEGSRYLIDRYGDAAFDPNFLSSQQTGTATNQSAANSGLLGDLQRFSNTAQSFQNLGQNLGLFNKGGEVKKEWF